MVTLLKVRSNFKINKKILSKRLGQFCNYNLSSQLQNIDQKH